MKRLLGRSSGIERTIERVLALVRDTLYAEQSVAGAGLLQRLDARAKLLSALALLIAVSMVVRLPAVVSILAAVIILGMVSRVRAATIARSLALPVVLFAVAIALPAVFVTPGEPVVTLPAGISISDQGIRSASLLASRVITAAAIGMTLVMTTPWASLVAALRALRIPAVVVVLLGMTYRYIFVLLRVTEEMFVARRSRLLAAPTGSQARQVMVRTGGVLLARSIDQSQQIYQAMVSRGFSGDVRLMEPSMLRARDWVAMIAAAAVSVALIAWGRR